MPRIVQRTFPDSQQVGVPSAILINQSRVTFSGQRGTVLVAYFHLFQSSGSVVRLFVGVELRGSASISLPLEGASTPNFDTNSLETGLWTFFAVQDPPEGSFVELFTRLSTSVVVIPANRSRLIAVSFADEIGAGPIVSV